MNNLNTDKITLLFALSLMQGCMPGPGFFTKSGSALTELQNVSVISSSVEDGATTGSFDSASNLAQSMTADAGSTIAGASIEILPGSLAISTDMTLEEGSDLSASIFNAMSLDNSIANSGVAVAISNSNNSDMLVPMTLNIPLPQGSQLTAGNNKLVVLFQRYNATKGEMSYGIIPNKDLLVKDGVIRMFTKYFGIYQSAYVENPIEEMTEVPTNEKLVTKREQNGDSVSPTDKFVFNGVTVASFTNNSIVLAWGFANDLSATVAIKIQEDEKPKSCMEPGFIRKPSGAKTHEFKNLKGNTKYFFALCLLDKAEKMHDSKILEANTSKPVVIKPDVASVNLVAESNYHVSVDWVVPAETVNVVSYLVSYTSGNGTVPNPKEFCADAQLPNESDGDFWITGFSQLDTVKVRVCVRYSDGLISKGVVKTVETLERNNICDSGDLDTVCYITANKALIVTGTHMFAGKGSVVIDNGVSITSSANEVELVFVLGGDLRCENGGGGSCIDLTGGGYAGGNSTDLNGIGNSGFGGGMSFTTRTDSSAVFYVAGSSGGSHGGQGGRPSLEDPISLIYGKVDYPETFGAGGGTLPGGSDGGSGGGVIKIFADNLFLHDAYIRADGENGNNGSSGGAGGSILVEVNTITIGGSYGKLSVRGGSSSSADSGAGGGGLIAVYHKMNILPEGFYQIVDGGLGSSPPSTAGTSGPAPFIQGP